MLTHGKNLHRSSAPKACQDNKHSNHLFPPTDRIINLYYWNNQRETIKFDDEDYCRAAYKKLSKYIAYPF